MHPLVQKILCMDTVKQYYDTKHHIFDSGVETSVSEEDLL